MPPSATITIAAATGTTNDSLTAKGGDNGAGIGGSYLGGTFTDNGAGSITINSGNIIANGGDYGAGIGGGLYGNGGTLTISGGTIEATGGTSSEGIGGGEGGAGGEISISGGTIEATGGGNAPNDIGNGDLGSGGSIKITGGSVNATSVAPQPTNDGSTPVYLNTLTVGSSANASTAITAASVSDLASYTYGINDVYTDASGIVYFWLPDTTGTESVTVTADGVLYGATWTRSNSNRTETLTELSISDGNVVITQYDDGYTVTIGGTYTSGKITYNQPYVIAGYNGTNIVTVTADSAFSGDEAVQITLKGVTISNDESPFQLGDNTVVALTLNGTNSLTCTNTSGSNGIYAGLYVSPSAAITIAAATGTTDDSLTATGGYSGAGIGGGYWGDGGTIDISGGEITATGGDWGAGIGGGFMGAGGNITISGGTITAARGSSAPNDIGYGNNGSGTSGSITITGGSVNPTNGAGAVYPQPTNGSVNVYLNTLTMGSPAVANTAITAASVSDLAAYGTNDVKTDASGIIYFWLPETTDSQLVTVADDSATYGAYFARSNNAAQILYTPFTVSFETGGGSSVADQSIYYGGKVSVASTTKNGYSFAGWYKDNSLTTPWDFDTDTITENTTIYAKWDASTYNIYYVLNSGTNNTSNPASYTYGVGVASFANASRTGYTFNGWYEESAFTTPISSISTSDYGDKTLYAKWTANDHTVTYNANGGNGSDYVDNVKYDDVYTVKGESSAGISRSGYTFTGWNTQADGGGNEYKANETFSITADTTLYAHWTYSGSRSGGSSSSSTSYTLTFETNGGSAISSVSKSSGTVVSLSGYTTTRDGYTFTGWYSDSALTTKVTSITLTKNTTVYAGWELTEEEEKQSTTHEPYILGYEDSTFRPDSSVTRAETAQLLYNISGASGAGSNKFSDVSSNQWYYNAVTTLTNSGVISGYTDGTFKPNNSITRAEFVALVVRYTGLTEATGSSFSDVSSDHWAAGYIATATQVGYISGYNDGSFRPDNNITRAEAVTVLNAMLGREVDKAALSSLIMPFSDMPTSHWAYYEIMEAAVEHEQAYKLDGR